MKRGEGQEAEPDYNKFQRSTPARHGQGYLAGMPWLSTRASAGGIGLSSGEFWGIGEISLKMFSAV